MMDLFGDELMKAAENKEDVDESKDATVGDKSEVYDDWEWEKDHEPMADVLKSGSKDASFLHSLDYDDDDEELDLDNDLKSKLSQLVIDDDDENDEGFVNKGSATRKAVDLNELFGPSSPPGLFSSDELITGVPNIWGSPVRESRMKDDVGGMKNLLQSLQRNPSYEERYFPNTVQTMPGVTSMSRSPFPMPVFGPSGAIPMAVIPSSIPGQRPPDADMHQWNAGSNSLVYHHHHQHMMQRHMPPPPNNLNYLLASRAAAAVSGLGLPPNRQILQRPMPVAGRIRPPPSTSSSALNQHYLLEHQQLFQQQQQMYHQQRPGYHGNGGGGEARPEWPPEDFEQSHAMQRDAEVIDEYAGIQLLQEASIRWSWLSDLVWSTQFRKFLSRNLSWERRGRLNVLANVSGKPLDTKLEAADIGSGILKLYGGMSLEDYYGYDCCTLDCDEIICCEPWVHLIPSDAKCATYGDENSSSNNNTAMERDKQSRKNAFQVLFDILPDIINRTKSLIRDFDMMKEQERVCSACAQHQTPLPSKYSGDLGQRMIQMENWVTYMAKRDFQLKERDIIAYSTSLEAHVQQYCDSVKDVADLLETHIVRHREYNSPLEQKQKTLLVRLFLALQHPTFDCMIEDLRQLHPGTEVKPSPARVLRNFTEDCVWEIRRMVACIHTLLLWISNVTRPDPVAQTIITSRVLNDLIFGNTKLGSRTAEAMTRGNLLQAAMIFPVSFPNLSLLSSHDNQTAGRWERLGRSCVDRCGELMKFFSANLKHLERLRENEYSAVALQLQAAFDETVNTGNG